MNLYYCKLSDNKNIIEYGTINQLYKPKTKINILNNGFTTDFKTYAIFDIDFKFGDIIAIDISILNDLKSRIRQDKLEILLR